MIRIYTDGNDWVVEVDGVRRERTPDLLRACIVAACFR